MRRLIACAALAFCVSIGLAQFVNAQTGAVEVLDDAVVYPEHAASLEAVHFESLKYNLGKEWVPFRNGKYSKKYKPFGGADAEIEDVWLFDEKDGVRQYALVSIYFLDYGGSSSSEGYVTLLEVRNGRLVQTQQFSYDAQAPGTGASFDPSKTTLTVVGRSDDHTPNCCPEHVDVVTYSWAGELFQQTGFEVRPVHSK
jgi:hypothetical protein